MEAVDAQNRYQERFGLPKPRTRDKVRDHLHPWVAEFIAAAPLCVMATADADGRCDASPKGGQPGFVRVLDDRHLLVPDIPGNNLFHSFANVDRNPHVALLFLIPGVDDVARVNGSVRVVDVDDPLLAGVQGAHQGLVVEVEEAYGHCPIALRVGGAWDVERTTANRAARPVSRKPLGV